MKPDANVAPGQTPKDKVLEVLSPKIVEFLQSINSDLGGETAVPKQPAPIGLPSNRFPELSWDSFLPQLLVIASSTGGPS